MKLIKLLFALLAFSLVLSACSPQGSSGYLDFQCDDFYENPHITDSIEAGVGDEFTVNLCSNASTGFQWKESVDISDPGVVEQVSHDYNSPSEKGGPPPPGTPGSQNWTFKTLKHGTCILSFEYSRDWEGGEKGEWTFVLTIIVK